MRHFATGKSAQKKNVSFCHKKTLTQRYSLCSLRAVGIMKVTRLITPRARHSPVVMKYPSRSVIQVPPMSEHIAFPCSETHSAAWETVSALFIEERSGTPTFYSQRGTSFTDFACSNAKIVNGYGTNHQETLKMR